MSIQTTMNISRQDAISRITKVCDMAQKRKYRDLEASTFEASYDLEHFVNYKAYDIDPEELCNFTNDMLEEVIDRPFFRVSMFENYNVVDNG